MSAASTQPTAPTHAPPPRHRARFDALRQQFFAEMGCATARWRLAWVVPFNVIVLLLLALRGFPRERFVLQVVAFGGSILLHKLKVRRMSATRPLPPFSMAGTAFFYFLGVANTGGLASPLLVSGFPVLFAASLQPLKPRVRIRFFAMFVVGVFALVFLAHTPVGALVGPLAPAAAAYSSAEYVVIAAGTFLLTIVAVYMVGKGIGQVYEQVAFELAERREEICSDTEDRTRALEGIAARLAHEVKNPLAAIKGLSTHMARSATDPKTAERLAIVAAEADRLQGIVDGFLSFSRGLDDLQLGPVVPHAVARELSTLLETRAADAGVKLEVKGSEELVLNADGRKIRQALLNLVLNAMQASPPGETVTIEVAKCCGGAACMKVIDRGQGMSAEVLDRIRRPYFTTKEGGTGLGVAVARGLIEQHGGQLHYESRPGKGTTVTIDLPACAGAAKKAQELPNPARAEPAAN